MEHVGPPAAVAGHVAVGLPRGGDVPVGCDPVLTIRARSARVEDVPASLAGTTGRVADEAAVVHAVTVVVDAVAAYLHRVWVDLVVVVVAVLVVVPAVAGGVLGTLALATVVVGIAYDKVEAAWRENRNRDLTPVEMEPNEWISVSGGGPEFLAFIEEELIPVIDARYRTDPADRTLSGASFAGLFTLYAMFEKPDLFHRYLAAVPSLWYGDGVLYQMEEAYARGRDDARARLYMSGEGFAASDWAPQYWQRLWDMTARLRQHEWENFHVKTEIMEGEHHASAQPRSFTRGLLWLFEKPAP